MHPFRVKINISGSNGVGSEYQIELKIGENSGSSDYDFHLNGLSNFPSSRGDGYGLLFTSPSGKIYPYFVRSVSGTAPNRTAIITVRFLDSLDSNNYMYCYFGGVNNINQSKPTETFEYYNDFSNDTDGNTPTGIIGTYWTVKIDNDGTHYIENSNDDRGTFDGISIDNSKIRVKARYVSGSYIRGRVDNKIIDSDNIVASGVITRDDSLDIYQEINGTWEQGTTTTNSYSAGEWFEFDTKLFNSNGYISANGVSISYDSIQLTGDGSLAVEAWAGSIFDFTNIEVSKYYEPEPVFSDSGNIEIVNNIYLGVNI